VTQEVKAMNKQYGARRTRLREHLLPCRKKKNKETNKSTKNQKSVKSITTLLTCITQLIKNQHTTFRCQQADILFTSEPRVQSDVSVV